MIVQFENLFTHRPPGRKIIVGNLLTVTHVRAGNIGEDLIENARNILGGKMRHYSHLLRETINESLTALSEQARASGYHGVCGIRISHTSVVEGAAEVIVCGNGFYYKKPAKSKQPSAKMEQHPAHGDIVSSQELTLWISTRIDEEKEHEEASCGMRNRQEPHRMEAPFDAYPEWKVFSREDFKLELLRRIDLFASLNGEELNILTRAVVCRGFEKGEIILRQGEPGATMYVLLLGELEVRLSVRPDGDDVIRSRLRPGEFFGEMSLLSGAPRSATILASTPCVTYQIAKEGIIEIFARRPQLYQQVSRVIARRKTLNQLRARQLMLSDVDERTRTTSQTLASRIKAFLQPILPMPRPQPEAVASGQGQ